MFDWIKQNHLHFVTSCTEIGSNQRQAGELQENHRNFATNSMVLLMSNTSVLPSRFRRRFFLSTCLFIAQMFLLSYYASDAAADAADAAGSDTVVPHRFVCLFLSLPISARLGSS